MIYALVGEFSLIDKQIQELLREETNVSIVKYDFEETSVLKILEDINTISLFGEKKVLICTNLNKIDDEEALIKYLNNRNDNILIFKEKLKLDDRKKLTKELKKNGTYIDVSNIDLTSYIKDYFKDYEISNMAVNLLKDYCNNDFNRIKNEIDKLKMYKLEEKVITSDDIKLIVKQGLDKNVFDLLNAISRKNPKLMYSVYYDLLDNNEDEIKLISILYNNFKLIFKVKLLTKNNSDTECIKILNNMHSYRFKLLKEQAYSYEEKELLAIIKNLSELDINIKSGVVDKKIGLELLLAKL